MTTVKGAITVGLNCETSSLVTTGPSSVDLTTHEQEAYALIVELISTNGLIDQTLIQIRKTNSSYTSVFYGDYNDFVRFKLTDRTKWISIRIPHTERNIYIDSPLFVSQKNKNQLHWKTIISSIDDLHQFQELLIKSCLC